ncbi:MAG: lipopolysaccharide assembly protein LapB [Pseudohongiellaceae bacterium]
MTASEVFFVLLAAASFVSGWLLASRRRRRTARSESRLAEIFHDYFVGLNYLLNDEPDEAIDTFIRALEVNNDTVETHLALGTLLRRRGKVDKAITVHQALLERPDLDPAFMAAASLELATDYVAAGLLDRAERLLKDLLESHGEAPAEALQQLMTVYQIEKEWNRAVECADRLLQNPRYKKDAEVRSRAAHYCCEQADDAFQKGMLGSARESISRALDFDRASVRATLLSAELEQKVGNYRKAVKELVYIMDQHPEFTSDLISPLVECHQKLGDEDGLQKLLQSILIREPRMTVILELTRLEAERSGQAAAAVFLSARMAEHPSIKGLVTLLQLQLQQIEGSVQENLKDSLKVSRDALDSLVDQKPGYRCTHCGFELRGLIWQCPSCQKWDTIKPILGLEGE